MKILTSKLWNRTESHPSKQLLKQAIDQATVQATRLQIPEAAIARVIVNVKTIVNVYIIVVIANAQIIEEVIVNVKIIVITCK